MNLEDQLWIQKPKSVMNMSFRSFSLIKKNTYFLTDS